VTQLPTISDVAPVVAVVKDLALAVAALATAYFAARGLKTWREELRGKADFEVARALARATLKVRDEIASARSPFTYTTDSPLADPEGKAWERARLFRERWAPVEAALREFDASAIESEALWGKEIRERTQALRTCAVTLWVAWDSVIDDARAGGDHFKSDPDFGRRTRAQVFASPQATDNQLSNDIASAVEGIEAVLRRRMAHSR
jgi:hypothetical protein